MYILLLLCLSVTAYIKRPCMTAFDITILTFKNNHVRRKVVAH